MRLSAPLLTLAGTVAGTAAAVVAYQATATTVPTTRPASVTTQEQAPVAGTTFLPCGHGWKVVGTDCVRIKEKVVVVHDLPAAAAAPARSAGVPSASGGSTGGATASQNENETEHAGRGAESETAEPGDDSPADSEQASDGGQDVEQPGLEDVGGDD